jgi:hypothetical protein
LQSALLHSQLKSTLGTPTYTAPEILSKKEYDGKARDQVVFMLDFALGWLSGKL